jgi:hypothetical protein
VDATGNIVEFLTRSGSVGEDGSFLVTDVPMDQPQSAYVVSVVYDGVEFSSGALINPGQPTLDLPLTIYEHTTDASVITLDAMHVLVRYHPDALLVTQILIFSNGSDRVYVSAEPVSGGRRGSVHFQLPPEAFNVQFEEGTLGGRFVPVGDEIYDTAQVLPGAGSHTIVMVYLVPYDGSFEMALPLPYNTRQVTLLAQEGGRVRAPMLTEAGSEVIEESVYDKFTAIDLPAGETLSITLRGTPGAGVSRWLLPALGVLSAALIVSAGAYWAVRRRETGSGTAEGYALSGEALALARRIAELDEAFEAGRMNRLEYEARRAALKADLADLVQGDGN